MDGIKPWAERLGDKRRYVHVPHHASAALAHRRRRRARHHHARDGVRIAQERRRRRRRLVEGARVRNCRHRRCRIGVALGREHSGRGDTAAERGLAVLLRRAGSRRHRSWRRFGHHPALGRVCSDEQPRRARGKPHRGAAQERQELSRQAGRGGFGDRPRHAQDRRAEPAAG